jgi:hypothetical protein
MYWLMDSSSSWTGRVCGRQISDLPYVDLKAKPPSTAIPDLPKKLMIRAWASSFRIGTENASFQGFGEFLDETRGFLPRSAHLLSV